MDYAVWLVFVLAVTVQQVIKNIFGFILFKLIVNVCAKFSERVLKFADH